MQEALTRVNLANIANRFSLKEKKKKNTTTQIHKLEWSKLPRSTLKLPNEGPRNCRDDLRLHKLLYVSLNISTRVNRFPRVGYLFIYFYICIIFYISFFMLMRNRWSISARYIIRSVLHYNHAAASESREMCDRSHVLISVSKHRREGRGCLFLRSFFAFLHFIRSSRIERRCALISDTWHGPPLQTKHPSIIYTAYPSGSCGSRSRTRLTSRERRGAPREVARSVRGLPRSQTTLHTHIQTYVQFRAARWPNLHVFGRKLEHVEETPCTRC